MGGKLSERQIKKDRLENAIREVASHADRESIRELIYTAATALRQGSGLSTSEIEDALTAAVATRV